MRLISETALPKTHLVYLHVELGFAVRVDGVRCYRLVFMVFANFGFLLL